MKRIFFAVIFAVAALCGCVEPAFISKSYDFNRIKRIGVLNFNPGATGLTGIEDICAKYLLKYGFQTVERSQLEQILGEQKIGLQGAFDPQTIKSMGKILGVDALMMGDVISYTPERQEIAMTETNIRSEEPVYQTKTVTQPNGTVVSEVQQVGTNVRHENSVTPQLYTISAQVGISMKLVDVETGEVVWVASYTTDGVNALLAVESSVSYLIKILRKQWKTG